MSKRNWLIAGTASMAIVIAVYGIVLVQGYTSSNALAGTKNTDNAMRAISTEQALALSSDAPCLVNDTATKTKAQSIPALSEDSGIWTEEIYDVPAGTHVDVSVASYNGTDTVKGSLLYSGQYGSYNVTLTKQNDGWRYTQFTGCH